MAFGAVLYGKTEVLGAEKLDPKKRQAFLQEVRDQLLQFLSAEKISQPRVPSLSIQVTGLTSDELGRVSQFCEEHKERVNMIVEGKMLNAVQDP